MKYGLGRWDLVRGNHPRVGAEAKGGIQGHGTFRFIVGHVGHMGPNTSVKAFG